MRSNTTNSAIKRSNKRSKSHLPLALTAIVAVFALGSVADAAQRMGASGGFAGHSAGGFAAKISGGALTGITRMPGNSGGKPGAGGNNSADGGRHSGGHSGNGRPHEPRFPKDPIINQSIDWALARGARIINMSFTGPRDPSIEQRMAQARKQGLILIAAAGNAGAKSGPLYPAAYSDVIAVTATNADDGLFPGASRGKHIAVAAPGVDLLLPAPEAGYQMTTGTSFAAAEVSGIAALLLERKPDLGYDGVRKALTATARDLGPKGVDPQFGAGLVDAYRAILSLEPATTGTTAKAVPAASE